MVVAICFLSVACVYLLFWRPNTKYRLTYNEERYWKYHIDRKVLFFWWRVDKTDYESTAISLYERRVRNESDTKVIRQNF